VVAQAVEEAMDERRISIIMSRVRLWLEDDDSPIIADEQGSSTEEVISTAATMNTWLDDVGAGWEVRVGSQG
jgi:hypothetical protein